MKFFKINLKDKKERAQYSEKLKAFESEFIYPLGEKTFTIEHGQQSDYFSFFEQFGEVHYMIIEKENKVVGALCSILRTIGDEQSWYLCDFKIAKAYRGKSLYRYLVLKFFLSHYMKNSSMFSINMSPPKNNSLYHHIKKILKLFSIEIESRYLYSFNKNFLTNFDNIFWQSHYIATNMGKKDIIVESKPLKLYHIVHNINILKNVQKIALEDLPMDSEIMLLSKLNILPCPFIEVSYIHRDMPNVHISSAEI